MKQIIISIGREFGSGGHVIAEKLAQHYGIPLYSKELLDEIAKEGEYSKEFLEKFDEKPMNITFMPHSIVGNGTSFEQDIAIKQFNFLKNKAAEGESFVVVGRCADEVLADNPNLVSLFILGDTDSKLKRVMEREGLDEKSALAKMKKMDKIRKSYHNFYCENKWGDSRGYDLCIKTGKISIELATQLIKDYIKSCE